MPEGYEDGYRTCVLRAHLRNYSKHHLNKLTFEVGSWRFGVGDMVANSYEDDVLMSRVDVQKSTCMSQAAYLVDNLRDAAALECSIPNMAEGDCQALVSFSTTLDAEALARIGAEERSLMEKRQREEEAAKAAVKATEAQKKEELERQRREQERQKKLALDQENERKAFREAHCSYQAKGETEVSCIDKCNIYGPNWNATFNRCYEKCRRDALPGCYQ